MEEKILIKAVFSSLKFLVTILWVLTVICFLVFAIIAIDWEEPIFILTGSVSTFILVLTTLIITEILKRRELIVTNKRVIARGAFGYREDLPIEKVTNVSMCFFNGIGCGSPSAKIKYHFCKNMTEVFDTIISESLQRDSKYK